VSGLIGLVYRLDAFTTQSLAKYPPVVILVGGENGQFVAKVASILNFKVEFLSMWVYIAIICGFEISHRFSHRLICLE